MRKRYVLGLLAIAVGSVFAVWQLAYHGIHPRLIFNPPPAEILPSAALEKIASLDVQEMLLTDVLDELSERYDIEIQLDRAAMVNAGLMGNEKIDFKMSGIRLRSLLKLLVRQVSDELVTVSFDGKVRITTHDFWYDVPKNYRRKVYRLEELIGAGRDFNEEDLADAVMTTIDPDSWEDNGGGIAQIHSQPGMISILQTPDRIAKVDDLLKKLATVEDRPDTREPIAIDPASSPSTEAIHRALKETTTLNFPDWPLGEVCEYLSEQYKVPIWIDVHELEALGKGTDTPIFHQASGITLRSALQRILSDLDLALVIRNEVLVITTTDRAEIMQATVLYPVGDLLEDRLSIDSDSLIEAIVGCIAPDSWDENGGMGSLNIINSTLVTSQTEETHRQLQQMLNDVRHALFSDDSVTPTPSYSPARKKIEQTLAKRVSLDYYETPLKKVAEHLSKQHGISVQLHMSELEAVGKGDETLVTFDANDATLESALRWMLRQLELTFIVKDESLLFTTIDYSETQQETKCYRSRGIAPFNEDDLIEAITGSVTPDYWEENGGAGSINLLGNVLVVSHTRATHQHIDALLNELNRFQASQEALPASWVFRHHDRNHEKIIAALKKRGNVDFSGTPLRRVAQHLSDQFDVPIRLDKTELKAIKVDPDKPITATLTEATLDTIFNRITRDLDLGYVLQDGALWITSQDFAETVNSLRLYDVRDLVDGKSKIDAEDLIAAVENGIDMQSWENRGGPGSVQYLSGTLIVSQTLPIHRQVEHLLEGLRQHLAENQKSTSRDLRFAEDSPEQKIFTALQKEVDVDVRDKPLVEFVKETCKAHNIPLRIDPKTLSDNKFLPHRSVDVRVKQIRLDRLLEHTLADGWLSYCIRDGRLLVTDSATAVRNGEVRLHDISDLLTPLQPNRRGLHDPFSETQQDFQGTWIYNPNRERHPLEIILASYLNEIAYYDTKKFHPTIVGDAILLVGPPTLHRAVDALLAKLRRVLLTGVEPVLSDTEKLLQQPVTFRCKDVPLTEAINDLAADHRLPLWIDQPSFSFTDLEETLTCDVKDVPLAEAIRSHLEYSRELVATIDDGVILITSPSLRNHQHGIEVFDVGKILKQNPKLDRRQLCRLVVRSIDTKDSWQRWPVAGANEGDIDMHPVTHYHGKGVLDCFSHALVVMQTRENQQQIRRLLELIAQGSNELPTPEQLLAKNNARAVERLMVAIDKAKHPLVRGYALAMVELIEKPPRKLTDLLAEQLKAVDPLQQPEEEFQLFLALSHGDSSNPALAAVILRLIEQASDEDTRMKMIYRLTPLGAEAVETLNILIDKAFEKNVYTVLDVIGQIGPEAVGTVPGVLKVFVEKNNNAAARTLQKIDPQGKAMRATLKKWRANPASAPKMDLEEIEEKIRLNLGDGSLDPFGN